MTDWFTQFAGVYNAPREPDPEPEEPAGRAKQPLAKQRKRGSRKVLLVGPRLQL